MKETKITEGGRTMRYLLCRSEGRAEQEAGTRYQIIERLEQELAQRSPGAEHTRSSCSLLTKSGYKRYLVAAPAGELRIDRAKVAADAPYDGKYVLMTNELDLPPEEAVLGYRDLWKAERAFRSMKSLLDLEPVRLNAAVPRKCRSPVAEWMSNEERIGLRSGDEHCLPRHPECVPVLGCRSGDWMN